MHNIFGKMTVEEINQIRGENTLVVVPLGSMEQHGRHLSVNTDSMLAEEITKMACATAQSRGAKLVVLPVLPFGSSDHHLHYGGTISISPSNYAALIFDIVRSLLADGFKRIIFVNGHGGNTVPISMALIEAKLKYQGVLLATCDYWNMAKEEISSTIKTSVTGHACEIETSLALYFDAGSVRIEKMAAELPHGRLKGEKFSLIEKGAVGIFSVFSEITESGVIGDPTQSTRETGETIAGAIAKNLAEVLLQLCKC